MPEQRRSGGENRKELEEQRRLITRLHETVQHLSKTVLQVQTLRASNLDASTDANTNTMNILVTATYSGNHSETQPSSVPLDSSGQTFTLTSPDSTESPSPSERKHFDISDDDVQEEQPQGVPNFDLTEDMFKVFQGKVDEEDIALLRDRYVKVVRMGKHLHEHPRDDNNKISSCFSKGRLLTDLLVSA